MLQRLVYPIIRPIMRLMHYRIDRRLRHVPHPVDSPHVHAPGSDPDRVLLFGSGPAVGYGVLSNDLALPGHLARQLSAITGRGVDIDVIADQEVTIQGSLGLLSDLNLWRYDAILLTIGVNNALLLTPLTIWRKAISELLTYVSEHVPQSTRVFVVAVPPIRAIDPFTRVSGWLADQHSVALNRETKRIVSGFPHFTFVPFSPLASTDRVRYHSAATYQQWATIIVAPLSQQLALEPRDGEEIERSPDEEARQSALDAMGILNTGPEERFDRVARLATQMFGTHFSAITFIDRDRHWVKAGVNVVTSEVPREGSFGDIAIHAQGVFVVPDATKDDRFATNPNVPPIRFFAGYPLESAFGERVGIISVFGSELRDWSDADTELLRELALMVQRELLGE